MARICLLSGSCFQLAKWVLYFGDFFMGYLTCRAERSYWIYAIQDSQCTQRASKTSWPLSPRHKTPRGSPNKLQDSLHAILLQVLHEVLISQVRKSRSQFSVRLCEKKELKKVALRSLPEPWPTQVVSSSWQQRCWHSSHVSYFCAWSMVPSVLQPPSIDIASSLHLFQK